MGRRRFLVPQYEEAAHTQRPQRAQQKKKQTKAPQYKKQKREQNMKCPFCGHLETQVVETRMSEDGDSIRRRRQCGACEKRYTTYERADVSFPNIVKKDGRRIEYKREKLLESMGLALRKRPVSTEQVDNAIERIEEKLLGLGQREVPSTRIGELVMRELKKLDKVAYIRFASVYRSFEDIDDFKSLVDEVRK